MRYNLHNSSWMWGGYGFIYTNGRIVQAKRTIAERCVVMTTDHSFLILDGPSVNRIWDSAKYTFDKKGARVPVEFTVQLGGAHFVSTMTVLSVAHTDGSGNELKITGYMPQLTSVEVEMLYRGDRQTGSKGRILFRD